MRLLAGGDSFTNGAELLDKNSVWAKQLATKQGLPFENVSHPGIGNKQIVHRVMQAVQPGDVVVVMFTFIARHDIITSFPNKEQNNPWYTCTPHHADLDKQHWFSEDYTRRAKEFGTDSYSREHYKVTGDLYEAYTTLEQILLLQQFLEHKNCKYMFTTADTFQANYEIQNPTLTKPLINNVNWDRFFQFKRKHEPGVQGFYRWAVENNFERGPGMHPLDKAHEEAVKLMEPKFNELF